MCPGDEMPVFTSPGGVPAFCSFSGQNHSDEIIPAGGESQARGLREVETFVQITLLVLSSVGPVGGPCLSLPLGTKSDPASHALCPAFCVAETLSSDRQAEGAGSRVSDTAFLGSFHVLSLVGGLCVLTDPVLRAKACPLSSEPRSVNYRRGVKVSLISVPSATRVFRPPLLSGTPHRPPLPPVSV